MFATTVRAGAAIVAAVLSATTLAAPAPAHAAVSYRAIELDALTNNVCCSSAADINDRGEIVGVSTVDSGESHAVVWRNGVPTDLGTLGGDASWANSINNSGDIVGTSLTADQQYHAFLWRDGTMIDLGGLPRSEYSQAIAINDRGDIVGVSETGTAHHLTHAVMWRDGQIRDLGTLDNQRSSATDINNSGVAVGYATIDGLNVVPVRWTPAGIQTISTVVGGANAINNLGWIVGTAGEDALLWRRGQAIRIGPSIGDHFLAPEDINDRGTVASNGYAGPFVWRHGATTFLPQPSTPNGLYSRAEAINEDGQVVGHVATGTPEEPLGDHAIVWVPVS